MNTALHHLPPSKQHELRLLRQLFISNLHQATERYYTTILLVFTDYRFELLRRAYVDARV